jgi:6-phosphogluconolactonase
VSHPGFLNVMDRFSRRLRSLVALALVATAAGAAPTRVYLGTFTSRGSQRAEGIYVAEFDAGRGTLGQVRLAARATDPSWLALDVARQRLYSVNRPGGGGTAAAYAVAPDGALTLLNEQDTRGANPAHIALTPDRGAVVVSNYRGANFVLLPLTAEGRLEPVAQNLALTHRSVHPHRQMQPHPHSFNFSPRLGAALGVGADAGGDRLYQYRYEAATASLVPAAPAWIEIPAGSGPRHLSFHPTLPVAYAVNELFNTVAILDEDAARATLRYRAHVLTLPREAVVASTSSEIVVHPSGRFAYSSNRGHDSIAVYAVDPADGGLTPRGHVSARGRTPRNFVCDPTGRWLLVANQDSDTIAVFAIDPVTGALTPHGAPVDAPGIVCLRFWHEPERPR